MEPSEELVERVARALKAEDKKAYASLRYYKRLARAAISAMQSDGIPVYRHPDATDEFVKP